LIAVGGSFGDGDRMGRAIAVDFDFDVIVMLDGAGIDDSAIIPQAAKVGMAIDEARRRFGVLRFTFVTTRSGAGFFLSSGRRGDSQKEHQGDCGDEAVSGA